MTNPFILIVEDDERLANIFATTLKLDGFDTEIAPNGKIALIRLAVTNPAVIVLDLHLPYISGQEILRQIRVTEHLIKTPVVVVTADLAAAQDVRSSADLILTKPFKPSMLRKAVARVIPA